MLDVNLIRQNPEKVKKALNKRGLDPALVDQFLEIDGRWRQLTKKIDEARAQLNLLSQERKIAAGKTVKEKIKEGELKLRGLQNERQNRLWEFPNIPAEDVPAGKDENDNVFVREAGEKPRFAFPAKDYLELAEKLDWIDIKKAGAAAGSRFGYLKNGAALLEIKLIQFAFDRLVAKSFIPVIPPAMIKPEVFAGMGRLSESQKEERYFLEKDDLYLIGSAEHTLGPLHMEETLKDADLPKRYVGFSTCFRREAGSYGRDTKGILRVHQFDKVEMFSFARPEDSDKELEFLLGCQEELMKELCLPYRVLKICAGDLGFTDAKQYDIETWLPGQGQYRETHSASNTTDFQARGINSKYERGGFVHMLNATAIALGRTIIALMENYQTAAGTVRPPQFLL